MEYKKKFLEKMKNILLYLVEFLANKSLILKKYLKNC